MTSPTIPELAELDATAQADLVRAGHVSPLELVDAAIESIECTNARVNAVITPLYEKARASVNADAIPDGPFRGVPIVLKDIQPSAGDPMHAGMRLLRELGWVEDHDAHVVAKLKAAGFVVVGKANLPELEGGVTTEPVAYGPSRNPWNLDRSTGGSSGGSAAAVAARMVPVAHGTDSGGSIRIPASECGVVGLKPSRGRVSAGPDLGDLGGMGMFCPHVLTRSVRDTAAVLDVTAGWMPGDPYAAPTPRRPFAEEVGADPGRLRFAVWTGDAGSPQPTDPECVAAAEQAASLLESLGHHVDPGRPPGIETASSSVMLGAAALFAWYLDHWGGRIGRAITVDDVEPLTWMFAEVGRFVTATQLLENLAARDRLTREVADWWDASGVDVLVTPTVGIPPPPLGACVLGPDGGLDAFATIVEALARFTAPFNITGQPAISLPLSETADGLPIGVQLVGSYGREDVLLQVAAQLEAAAPWERRRPSISATR